MNIARQRRRAHAQCRYERRWLALAGPHGACMLDSHTRLRYQLMCHGVKVWLV